MNRNNEIIDFEAFLEENLFGEWADVLIETSRMFGDNNLAAHLWSRAKHYAVGIADSKNPVLKFRNRCNEIFTEFHYDPYDTRYIISGNPYAQVYSIVVGCVYTMIVFSAETRIAQQIIDNIEVYGTVPYCDIQNVVNAIIEKISKGEIECDYDYTKDEQNMEEETILPDLNLQLQEKDNKIQMLQEEVQKTKKELDKSKREIKKLRKNLSKTKKEIESIMAENDVGTTHSIDQSEYKFTNNIRYELYLRLLEKAGCEPRIQANQTTIGNLWEALTEKSGEKCRQYITTRQYQTKVTMKHIPKINALLKSMGIDIEL